MARTWTILLYVCKETHIAVMPSSNCSAPHMPHFSPGTYTHTAISVTLWQLYNLPISSLMDIPEKNTYSSSVLCYSYLTALKTGSCWLSTDLLSQNMSRLFFLYPKLAIKKIFWITRQRLFLYSSIKRNVA